jgi:hypothetical protein
MLWLMPQFIIRVELYEANGEDYLRLHAAMDGRGFKSTIVLEDDSVCMLPTAEYLLLSSSLTTQQVLGEAQSAARTVSISFGVIAVQIAEAPWVSGLKPARWLRHDRPNYLVILTNLGAEVAGRGGRVRETFIFPSPQQGKPTPLEFHRCRNNGSFPVRSATFLEARLRSWVEGENAGKLHRGS